MNSTGKVEAGEDRHLVLEIKIICIDLFIIIFFPRNP